MTIRRTRAARTLLTRVPTIDRKHLSLVPQMKSSASRKEYSLTPENLIIYLILVWTKRLGWSQDTDRTVREMLELSRFLQKTSWITLRMMRRWILTSSVMQTQSGWYRVICSLRYRISQMESHLEDKCQREICITESYQTLTSIHFWQIWTMQVP